MGAIKSNSQRSAEGIGMVTSNTAMMKAEIGIASTIAQIEENKTDRRQEMIQVGMDSLKTLDKIRQAKDFEKKIKKGYKLYQQVTKHQLDYDQVTLRDVLDNPSKLLQIGNIKITDTVTGREYTPGMMAAFSDIEDQKMFKDFAAGDIKKLEGIVPSEYGIEYEKSSFTKEEREAWIKKPENNEMVARLKYERTGIREWAYGSEVKVMQGYADDNDGIYSKATKATTVEDEKGNTTTIPGKPATVTLKDEFGNKTVLNRGDFRTGKGVEFDDIKAYLSKQESSDNPNAQGTNDETRNVYRYLDEDGNSTQTDTGKINPHYGTIDYGLYGINEKEIRGEDWDYISPIDSYTNRITTNQYSELDGKPDLLYKKVQSLIGLSSPGTRKDDMYQKGAFWNNLKKSKFGQKIEGLKIGSKIGNRFRNDDDELEGEI